MTYRVINVTTGEIAAELHDLDTAKKFADRLAKDDPEPNTWAVIELVTVYETGRRDVGR